VPTATTSTLPGSAPPQTPSPTSPARPTPAPASSPRLPTTDGLQPSTRPDPTVASTNHNNPPNSAPTRPQPGLTPPQRPVALWPPARPVVRSWHDDPTRERKDALFFAKKTLIVLKRFNVWRKPHEWPHGHGADPAIKRKALGAPLTVNPVAVPRVSRSRPRQSGKEEGGGGRRREAEGGRGEERRGEGVERAPCVCVCVRARGVRVSGECLTEGGGREASPPGAVGHWL